jgi:hypothetical protein
LFSAGCAEHEEHEHYGGGAYYGGGATYYDYDYYPDEDIYFYPEAHVYYWNDGGRWRSGRDLPPRYRLNEERREHLRLHSRQPWTEHHREGDRERHEEHEEHEQH